MTKIPTPAEVWAAREAREKAEQERVDPFLKEIASGLLNGEPGVRGVYVFSVPEGMVLEGYAADYVWRQIKDAGWDVSLSGKDESRVLRIELPPNAS